MPLCVLKSPSPSMPEPTMPKQSVHDPESSTPAATCWKYSLRQKPSGGDRPLLELLSTTLGNNGGLVRALFFDKPPERTWSLPWHKDFTIAVRDHRSGSIHFTKPTVKAGVPHAKHPWKFCNQC